MEAAIKPVLLIFLPSAVARAIRRFSLTNQTLSVRRRCTPGQVTVISLTGQPCARSSPCRPPPGCYCLAACAKATAADGTLARSSVFVIERRQWRRCLSLVNTSTQKPYASCRPTGDPRTPRWSICARRLLRIPCLRPRRRAGVSKVRSAGSAHRSSAFWRPATSIGGSISQDRLPHRRGVKSGAPGGN